MNIVFVNHVDNIFQGLSASLTLGHKHVYTSDITKPILDMMEELQPEIVFCKANDISMYIHNKITTKYPLVKIVCIDINNPQWTPTLMLPIQTNLANPAQFLCRKPQSIYDNQAFFYTDRQLNPNELARLRQIIKNEQQIVVGSTVILNIPEFIATMDCTTAVKFIGGTHLGYCVDEHVRMNFWINKKPCVNINENERSMEDGLVMYDRIKNSTYLHWAVQIMMDLGYNDIADNIQKQINENLS